jgi:hypothetical protein
MIVDLELSPYLQFTRLLWSLTARRPATAADGAADPESPAACVREQVTGWPTVQQQQQPLPCISCEPLLPATIKEQSIYMLVEANYITSSKGH